jgi:hypothetical protein
MPLSLGDTQHNALPKNDNKKTTFQKTKSSPFCERIILFDNMSLRYTKNIFTNASQSHIKPKKLSAL